MNKENTLIKIEYEEGGIVNGDECSVMDELSIGNGYLVQDKWSLDVDDELLILCCISTKSGEA